MEDDVHNTVGINEEKRRQRDGEENGGGDGFTIGVGENLPVPATAGPREDGEDKNYGGLQ